MWRQVVIYGLVLALAAVALEWLRFRHVTRLDSTEIYVAVLAIGFLSHLHYTIDVIGAYAVTFCIFAGRELPLRRLLATTRR